MRPAIRKRVLSNDWLRLRDAANDAPATPFAFDFIGSYQLLGSIGCGGVAQVFRARHVHPRFSERTCAVKIIHDALSGNAELCQLFRDEAYIVAMLDHPNVVQTYEAGTEGGRLFIAMEYIDGRDFTQILQRIHSRGEAVPGDIARWVIGETLEALAYAHEATDSEGEPLHLVHRDVNPHNILVSFDGDVKLADFGVAMIGKAGGESSGACGKVGYFAPEQLDDRTAGPGADVFAVGVSLYELLAGELPFGDPHLPGALDTNYKAKCRPLRKAVPGIGRELDRVVRRAMHPNPRKRFSNARALLEAMQPHIPGAEGMRLLLASLMRTELVDLHLQELRMRAGIAGADTLGGDNRPVVLFGTDPRARGELRTMAETANFRVREGDALIDLIDSDEPPAAVIVDARSRALESTAIRATLQRVGRVAPLIISTDGLDQKAAAFAEHVGAVDLIYEPFTPQRVCGALWMASHGAPKATIEVNTERPVCKVLLVSSDEQMREGKAEELAAHGYRVVTANSAADAYVRMQKEIFGAVIYDVHPTLMDDDRSFPDTIRSVRGVGLLPIVYLVNHAFRASLSGFECCSLRNRTDDAVVIARALDALRSGVKKSRTFTRFGAAFEADVFFKGRNFKGSTRDISRGGIMVDCTVVARLGSRALVRVRAPERTIEVVGRVVRIARAEGGRPGGIGVEIESIAQLDEMALVAVIDRLAAQQEQGGVQ